MVIKRDATLKDQAYKLIRKKILSQEYSFGEKLSIAELSRELGISNSPIREAITLLENDGLVKSESNYGFHVIDLDEDTFHYLAQSILVLMIGCYSQIVENNLIDDLSLKLNKAYSKQEKLFSDNFNYNYVCSAIDFDRCFVEATNNPMLEGLFDGLFDLLVLCTLTAYETGDEGVRLNLDEHKAILHAVDDHDHTLVNQLLINHYDKHDLPLFEKGKKIQQ